MARDSPAPRWTCLTRRHGVVAWLLVLILLAVGAEDEHRVRVHDGPVTERDVLCEHRVRTRARRVPLVGWLGHDCPTSSSREQTQVVKPATGCPTSLELTNRRHALYRRRTQRLYSAAGSPRSDLGNRPGSRRLQSSAFHFSGTQISRGLLRSSFYPASPSVSGPRPPKSSGSSSSSSSAAGRIRSVAVFSMYTPSRSRISNLRS